MLCVIYPTRIFHLHEFRVIWSRSVIPCHPEDQANFHVHYFSENRNYMIRAHQSHRQIEGQTDDLP